MAATSKSKHLPDTIVRSTTADLGKNLRNGFLRIVNDELQSLASVTIKAVLSEGITKTDNSFHYRIKPRVKSDEELTKGKAEEDQRVSSCTPATTLRLLDKFSNLDIIHLQ